MALGYKLYMHQLSELPDYALVPLADRLLLRFLRAVNPVDGHERDVNRVYHWRTEWENLSWCMDRLIEEATLRAEEGHSPEELDRALEQT